MSGDRPWLARPDRKVKRIRLMTMSLLIPMILLMTALTAPAYAYSAYTKSDQYSLYAEPPPLENNLAEELPYTDDITDTEKHPDTEEIPDTDDLSGSVEDGEFSGNADERPEEGAITETHVSTEAAEPMKAEAYASLVIACNVKGSLGDLSKNFEYDLGLSGLEPDAEYCVKGRKCDYGSGFAEGYFTSDSEGNAQLAFKISDNGFIEINGLPEYTAFTVTQQANDHEPYFSAVETKESVKSAGGRAWEDISTGRIIMKKPEIYTVDFTNSRELAPLTGMPNHRTGVYIFSLWLLNAAVYLLIRKVCCLLRAFC